MNTRMTLTPVQHSAVPIGAPPRQASTDDQLVEL
jgi:hypothetical protein